MSELSRLSETILDYAKSRAKRNWSHSVNDVHLAAAVRVWDEKWFDQEFPGVAEQLNRLLERQMGDSMKPESIEASVISRLDGVFRESELKDAAKVLIDDLRAQLEAEPEESRPHSRQVQEKSDSVLEKQDSPEVSQTTEQEGLQLDLILVSKIAELLGRDSNDVRAVLAADAREVAFRVLRRDDPQISDAITASLAVEGSGPNSGTISGLMSDLVNSEGDDAPRVATLLALALVDMAEFAASVDDVITDEEIERIDEIRLECRSVLANRIDATSDAIIEFERRFGELVGMDAVKKDLRKRVDFLMVSKKRAQRGRDTEAQRMHMAFVGNPGTGKTTVARLFGQLLNNLGLLPSDTFIEKDRSGLVGTHVGQTEEKTKSVIRQAEGGVLFIDEAYALNDRYGNQKGFGEEAVDVLVKEMEDKRDQLVVVLAGYKRPMEHFLTINPGLKSRIPSIIDFPDYSINELMEIADRIAGRRGLLIDEPARDKISKLVESIRDTEGFGNAREVENIMDAAQRNMTQRLSPLGNLATDHESRTIIADDIPTVDQTEKTRHIGFGRHLYL